MTATELFPDYQDYFEYHGGVVIEHIRKQAETVLRHDWILFDTVEEAREFITEHS